METVARQHAVRSAATAGHGNGRRREWLHPAAVLAFLAVLLPALLLTAVTVQAAPVGRTGEALLLGWGLVLLLLREVLESGGNVSGLGRIRGPLAASWGLIALLLPLPPALMVTGLWLALAPPRRSRATRRMADATSGAVDAAMRTSGVPLLLPALAALLPPG